MLSASEIRTYYRNVNLQVSSDWNLGRKHFRIETLNHRFVKLNRFENRINLRELGKYCVKYAPRHVYMSALNWLFPERVGKKHKANRAAPIGGEYVVDVDSYTLCKWHDHKLCSNFTRICLGCLDKAQHMAVRIGETVERYYSDIAIVFSGSRGFHVWGLDFDLADWTNYDERNPIKSHEVARFMFTKLVAAQSYGFNRDHFILSVDPMRILSVPNSMNAETGLVCSYIGDRKDLENRSIRRIVENAKPTLQIYGHAEPIGAMKHSALR